MKKITFLRNLITLAIVFVISGLVQAATGTMTITRGSFASGALAYGVDDLWTATTSQNNTITGYFDIYSTAGQATMQTRTNTPIGSYPYNTVAMPGPITKITLTGGATGTARAWTPYLATTSLTKSNYTSGASQGTKTAVDNSASTSWDVSSANNFRFFYLNMTGGAAYLSSIVIEYEIESANPTVATPLIEVTNGVAKSTDTYFNSAEITITSATEGASIYYTTNGDAPTTASTLYVDPFTITSTATIKALAVKAEMDDSGIAEKTITIVAPATATVPYTEAFNNTLGDWYPYEVAGAKPWVASANGAIGNGYSNPNADIESWLISPKFTATEDGLALSFNYASRYVGNPLLVKVSTNYIGYGSPAAATWTTAATILAPEVQDNDYTVKASGSIIHASAGTVYFALVYDNDAAPYSDWRITNASVILPPTGPTISVVEADIPEMSAYVDASDSETITVNGVNLTTDITLSLGGADAAQFRLSTSTLAQTDGSVTDASVTIYYEPKASGSHIATLTLSSNGATDVTKSLSGTATWAPLDAPVATAADPVSQTAFTANWNAVAGATEYELTVSTKEGDGASDLFISEYVEGSSSNKAIEIFNGTGASVDLSGYKIELYSNGASSASNTQVLSGSLANDDVFVVYNSSASPAIIAVGDISSAVANFNGDDAVVLKKGDDIIDVFGIIGSDPGSAWTDGDYSTVDKTLVRKSTVTDGVTVNPASGFPTLATEWDLYNQDYSDDLGSHTFTGGVTLTEILGSPFTVVGTSRSFSGLNEGGTFVYTVKAKNANVTSAVSNEIEVAVAGISVGTDNPTLSSSIYAHNANIHFTATAGEKVEVYNAVGQKIISTLAADGQNELSVNAKGVMIVKVGSRLAKVIL